MRILMVNKFLYPNGGSENYVLKLGEYLNNCGHQVEYFGMEHSDRIVGNTAGVYTANMDFHGRGVRRFSYPFRIIYSAEARAKIRKELDLFCPEVVHLNNFNYQLTPSIILEIRRYERESGRKVKIIYTAHDYQLVCPNHMLRAPASHQNCENCLTGKYFSCIRNKCIHGSLAKSCLGAMEAWFWNKKKVYSNIDAIICPTYFMKTKLDTNPVLKGKTLVLYNFIEKTEIAGKEKENYVLYFGRFSEEKGIRTLLEVCGSLPEIRFVFAGKGPLENFVGRASNIENRGFQSGKELRSLISRARFSVYPSEWYENCPFAVLESQVLGTPVLGADIGGIPELIKDGETGALFESGNAGELQKGIERMWNDREGTDRYTRNCRAVTFDTVFEYSQKLLKIYENRR